MSQIAKYIKAGRLFTFESIKSCKKIYLDINFWIRLRDASNSGSDTDQALLNTIEEAVEKNKCILPISEVTFREILKQKEMSSLKRSCSLIDRLSKGVCLINDDELRQLEYIHFIRIKTAKEVHPLDELVWSKLPLVVMYPKLPSVPNDYDLHTEMIKQLSDLSFLDMVSSIINSGKFEAFSYKDDVELFNKNKEKHKNENKSFEQMFLSELGGFIDLFQESLAEANRQSFHWDYGIGSEDVQFSDIELKLPGNMIYNLFKLKKVTNEFPSFSIFPELNAAVIWNKNRKYRDGNDTMDFFHAAAALPYFDYFFTERELATIIKQRKLDVTFKCTVESDVRNVLEAIKLL
ncbi:hypothetical protein [Dyadobacter sp. LHD-138]|uniref:hypothetical protein n=1 Tax=Dyadobacter sp. LHD-138 TaxID=3071413 RepID=UPI0027DEED70|nr:hypothetical protein [Dyadobacter sp. LHD-138]MDQ6482421.1 hypothetical protein [Dyadobacter sp. LHD-138]